MRKEEKEPKRKQPRHRSRSKERNRDRSRSRERRHQSPSRSRTPSKQRSTRREASPPNVARANTSPSKIARNTVGSRFRINGGALSSIIMEQKRTNFRMDRQEVDRANEKLKVSFPNENLQATLLSEYLSKDTAEAAQSLLDPIHRPFACTHNPQKCQMRFRYVQDLELHMQEHQNEQRELTNKAKRLLDSILHRG